MTTSDMMSVRDVRTYTGLSKTTVFKLINEGRLARVKVLGRTLITRESVETLCGQTCGSKPQTITQPSIDTLPAPKVGYRVDKDTRRSDGKISFETRRQCRDEDLIRARGLRRAIEKHPDEIDARQAQRLATELERSGETGESPDSPASSLFMGDQRRRIIAALWKLLEE